VSRIHFVDYAKALAIFCVVAVAICAVSIYLGSDGSAMVRSYYGPYGALSVLLLPENSFFYMMFEVILIIFVCLIFTKQKERLKRI
jgi:surface polysaccharide O-acyltransferase-like enzyme